METQNIAHIPAPESHEQDEQILVVKTATLFKDRPAWQGLLDVPFDTFQELVLQEKEFHPRSIMETDPRYKQIIPYLVFRHENSYFLMQRRATASEQRLKNKYSLGIGGHIRHEDIIQGSIIDWARREFNEEVDYPGSYTVKPLGILNDDSNPVGEVHIGCVLLIEGTSSEISVKSELKSGRLAGLAECEELYPNLERWSQFVVQALKAQS